MPDLACNWAGDLQFGATGDLLAVGGLSYTVQRISRMLLTNPAIRDVAGNIVQPGDYLFNQDFGSGLGKAVDELVSLNNQKDMRERIAQALRMEPSVDSSIPPKIEFFIDPNTNTQVVVIEFTTVEGSRAQAGIRL